MKRPSLKACEGTGRLVVVDESPPRCGMASDIAAIVAEKAFRSLKRPIIQVTAPHTPVPFAPALERAYVPGPPRIEAAIRRAMQGRMSTPAVQPPSKWPLLRRHRDRRGSNFARTHGDPRGAPRVRDALRSAIFSCRSGGREAIDFRWSHCVRHSWRCLVARIGSRDQRRHPLDLRRGMGGREMAATDPPRRYAARARGSVGEAAEPIGRRAWNLGVPLQPAQPAGRDRVHVPQHQFDPDEVAAG